MGYEKGVVGQWISSPNYEGSNATAGKKKNILESAESNSDSGLLEVDAGGDEEGSSSLVPPRFGTGARMRPGTNRREKTSRGYNNRFNTPAVQRKGEAWVPAEKKIGTNVVGFGQGQTLRPERWGGN